MNLTVQESAAFIAANSSHVVVNTENIGQLALKWKDLDWTASKCFSDWHREPHPIHLKDKDLLHYILLLDTLNFSFYADPNTIPYTVNNKTGYWSLCMALNRALDNGIDILTISKWDEIEWRSVFESDTTTPIPLLNERISNIKATASTINQFYNGDFSLVLKDCNGQSQILIHKLAKLIPHFDDSANYKGKKVFIMKRAQILVADIWAAFRGEGYGEFTDINKITMFADYRVPQALASLGMIVYDEYTLEALKSELPSQSALEIEIRGNSIHSVELLKEELNKMGIKANAIMLDFYLWKYAKDRTLEIPIHRTRCIYY